MMNTIPVQLKHQSQLIQDYRDRQESIFTQFDYDPFQVRSYQNRLKQIQQMNYKREELADILIEQNKKWGLSPEVKKNIVQLKDPESSVVIGGQQAGLLTGPLYTIHKIISIIIHAREQADHLQKPVVPVFWIAGEDHDFDEINHVFVQKNTAQLKKVAIQDDLESKQSVSSRQLPKEEARTFIEQVFRSFQETEHTQELIQQVKDAIEESETYVDFFGILIHSMFKEEGLVLVDSDDPSLRRLETEYFVRLIENQPAISEAVVEELEAQADKGYMISLDANMDDGHLFYHVNDERQLLMKKDRETWMTKDGETLITTDELIQLVKQSPELFSNNVITRPMMQEMVFPVLAFHAGPGELAYWSVLKKAFRCLDMTLPIVMPRMSITLLQANHQSWLNQLGLSEEEVIQAGSFSHKMRWLKRKPKYPIEETIEEVRKQMNVIHQPIQEIATSITPDMERLSKKNAEKIDQELVFIEKRLLKAVEDHHQLTVQKYDELDLFYYPNGGLQERIWNIVYWMNHYGLDLPARLASLPPKWEHDHVLVEL